jgi:methionyl-tRNA formyltransferase
MIMRRNIVYFGTPEFALAPLQALLSQGRTIELVVSQPDRPSGRGKKIKACPVKACAMAHDLNHWQPEKILRADQSKWQKLKDCIFVVCAYGKILPQWLLDIPYEIINIHASLLPEYRGASPIQKAIEDGKKETGISIMRLVAQMDAGDVLFQKKVLIAPDDNLGSLTEKLSKLGAQFLESALLQIEQGEAQWTRQDPDKVTYAPKIDIKNGHIDWNQSAQKVHDFIRSISPSPGAFAFQDQEKIKILETSLTGEICNQTPGTLLRHKKALWVATEDEWISIVRLQKPGKAVWPIMNYLNGDRSGAQRWQ